MPWKKIEPADPTGSPAPAYGLATDGTSLYVNFFDSLVKMPLAGGEVTTVHKSSEEIPLGFKTFQDDTGVLVLEKGAWVRIPFSGGAAEPLSVPLPNGAEVIDLDPATDTLWATVNDYSAKTTSVLKATIGAAAAETVISGQETGYSERWYRSGDRFFTQGPAGGSRPIYVAQPGGAPAPFAVSPPSAGLLGVTGTSVFYMADSFESSTVGVHRLPTAGGATQRVYSSYTTGGLSSQSWRTADALYVNDATYLLKFSDAGEAKRISGVPTSACTTHMILPHGGYVYTVTFRSGTGENTVWRIKE
jgi:hypothetical protein